MGDILEDFSTAALVKAIEANLWEFGAYLGQSPQVEMWDSSDMMWYATGVPHPMLNGVFRTQLASGETDVKIESALNYFRSRKLPMMWWIGPSTRPISLEQDLVTHGFTRWGDMLGMAVSLTTLQRELPVPSGLAVKQVGDSKTLQDWVHAFIPVSESTDSTKDILHKIFASLGLTQHLPLQHYIGWLDMKPVGCSSVFFGAGVAGIYNVTTVPGRRGQGIGTALTLAPLRRAHNMGYRIGILHSSPMGVNTYRRIGFEEYCKVRTYIS